MKIPARKRQWSDALVEAWAKAHPVGTCVRYWPVRGDEAFEDTEIRSEVWRLGHGMPIVRIAGRSGGVALDHLRKLPEQSPVDPLAVVADAFSGAEVRAAIPATDLDVRSNVLIGLTAAQDSHEVDAFHETRRMSIERLAIALPEIRPCPFCGGTSVRIHDCSDEIFRQIECDCGARGPVQGTEDEDEEFGDDYVKAAERDAIECWNTAPRREIKRRTRRLTNPRRDHAHLVAMAEIVERACELLGCGADSLLTALQLRIGSIPLGAEKDQERR